MQSVSPVWSDEEIPIERVIALDQPEYEPIIVLPIRYSDGLSGLAVRFRLTDEERKHVAEGADILITELTFGMPFTPIHVCTSSPNTNPYEENTDMRIEDLNNWFTYHAPTQSQQEQYTMLRDKAKELAVAFDACLPDCADKTAAVRKIRETVMAMNLAIACYQPTE